jgi:hypothetical protein
VSLAAAAANVAARRGGLAPLRSPALRSGRCATATVAPARSAPPAPHGGGFCRASVGISNCR